MTLTDEEITAISLKFSGVHNFVRAIEARVLEELRKQDLLKGMAEIRQAGYTDIVSDGGLDPRKAAPILPTPTPTPSQQEALDALDNMDDYARMMGLIAIGPIETLRDFILARPDTEGGRK